MPLQPQMLPVPFAAGVDSKTDPKQVKLGKLLVCQNAVFTSPGQLKKRPGQKSLTAASGTGKGLSTLGDELVSWVDNTLYSYSPATGVQNSRGKFQSPALRSDWQVRNQYGQSFSDGAATAAIRVYAYQDTRGGAWYTVVDAVTGTTLSESQLDANGAEPRTVQLGSYVAIFWRNTSDSKIRVIGVPTANPTSPTAASILVTTLNAANPYFAVVSDGATAFLAWNSSTATTLSVASVSTNLALTGPVNLSATINQAMDVAVFAQANVAITWYDGTNVRIATVDYNTLATVIAPLIVSATANVKSVCASNIKYATGGANDWQVAFSSGTAPASVSNYSNVIGGSPGSVGLLMRGLYLFAKPFTPAGGDAIIYPMALGGALPQNEYFLIRSDAIVAARMALSAAARGAFYALQQSTFDGTSWHHALEYSQVLTPLVDNTGAATPTVPTGASNLVTGQVGLAYGLYTFLDQQTSFSTAELAASLQIGGGMGLMYDGMNVVEQGFHYWPYSVSPAAAGSGTSKTNGGTYWYAVTYEWTDQSGRRHQSAPSFGISYVAASTQDVNVTVNTLRVTAKAGVQVVLYRTTNGGTTFYRVGVGANSTATDTVVILDNVTDASLQYGPYLYTLGGVLENDPMPAARAVTTWQGRLAYLPSEGDGMSYGISKLVAPGAPVECSTSFVYPVDPRGGPLTAMGALDEKLALFKRSAIYVAIGHGPDSTGGGDDLSQNPASLLTTDVGCTDQRSVVSMPDGLMFKSQKGIYLLNRSLQVEYVGAPVESFNGTTVISAVLVAQRNQVRFGLSTGQALVYDYFAKEWSTFTNYSQAAAVNWKDQYTILRADGALRQDDPTTFSDVGSYVPMLIKTSWIQLGGVQGFQRVWKVFILGEWKSAHSLLVDMAYDYNDSQVQQVIIAASDPGYWGSSSTWGSDVVWGGGTGDGLATYQYQVYPKKQRCQAIQLTLQDTGASGEGLSLSSLGFLVGTIDGGARVPAGRRFG